MKFLKKILIGIAFLLMAIFLFIGACSLNPDLSEKVGNILFSGLLSGSDNSVNDVSALSATDSTNSGVDTSALSADQLTADPYVEPESTEQSIDGEVAGRTGFVPVAQSDEQIDDTTAQSLTDEIGTGDLGEDLEFDSLYYPYYWMLDETMQTVYKQIFANASALTDQFTLSVTVTPSQFYTAFMAVCNDHPELFYLDTAYSAMVNSSGAVAAIKLQYNATSDDLASSQSAFDQAVDTILSQIPSDSSDFEKEVYLHDALSELSSYDLAAVYNQSAYSALVNGATVCAGYARAYQYLMQQAEIPTYFCTGYAGEDHAWNIVYLDGEYYNVDVTWDDTDPMTYDYFNCTDDEYASTHRRTELSVYLPACNGELYGDQVSVDNVTPSDDQTGTVGEDPAANDEQGTADQATTDSSSDADTLDSLETYYQDCYDKLSQTTDNPAVIQCIISDETLWNEIYDAYQNGGYEEGFLGEIIADKNAGGCQVQIQAELLDDGSMILSQTFTFQ